jgi:superfamily II DNA or RNA helicase
MRMDRDDISNFVGSRKIAERGIDYFEESRVLSLKTLPGVIEGSVIGSQAKPYKVRVELDRQGQPVDASCSCPHYSDGWYCKHIAAVLYAGRAKARERVNPILNAAERKETVTEMTITEDARSARRGPSFVEEIETALFPATSARMPAKRKEKNSRLVFVLEWSYDPRGASGPYGHEGWRWILTPKCQHVKQNGSPGVIFEYGRMKINLAASRAERILLGRLVSKDGKRDELLNHLDFLLEQKPVSLYIQNGSALYPLALEEIGRCTLRFVPELTRGDGFLFRPVLDAAADSGASATGLATRREVIVYGFSVLLVGRNGTCLFKTSDETFSGILARLFSWGGRLAYRDAVDLNAFCASRVPAIGVELPPVSIKVKRLVPRPILEIEQHKSGVVLSLRFSYSGSEVLYGEGGDLLPLGERAPRLGEKGITQGGEVLPSVLLSDGGDIYAARDRSFEKEVFSYMAARLRPSFSGSVGVSLFQAGLPAADFLAANGRRILDEGFEIRMKGEKRPVTGRRGRVGVTLSSGVDWLDLRVEYVGEDGLKSPVEIEPALLEGGLVRTGESYTIVTKDEVEKLKRLLREGMNRHGTLRLSRYRFSLIDELYDRILNRQDPCVLAIGRIVDRLRDFGAIEEQKPPRAFHGVLRDYQRAGLNWLFFLREYGLNGCLADDMGLGKTVQALAFLQKLKEKGGLGTALIVVPVTTVLNWEAEIKRFTPSLRYALHYGPHRPRDGGLRGFDVIITSYHTLRNDIELFKDTRYGVLVLDESQQFKNPGSLLWKACRMLDAEMKLAMTGTPLENNTFELWAQMEVLNPGLLGGKREFQERFAKPIEAERSEEAASELRKLVFPFILRRKKEDVVKELPPKSEIVLYSEMEDKQAALYTNLRERCREMVRGRIESDGIEKSALDIFSALLKLRQVALFPGLADSRYRGVRSCKFEQLVQLVREILQEDHKVLVFSQFVKALSVMRDHFEREGLAFSYIDGSMSARNRSQEVRAFEKRDGNKLFLLSLRAGGIGINLTSADYVVLFDPWWNPAVESQAIDRTHRIGQTRKVIAYKLIVKDTVEEKILDLQEKKKKLVREIVGADEAFFKSLSKEDILNLF